MRRSGNVGHSFLLAAAGPTAAALAAWIPMFTGKKVLITGALGTLGQALVGRFAAEGAKVYAWDRPDSPNAQITLDHIAEGVTFVGGDLNDLAND